jgi:Ca-activated chloride channel family protein
MRRVLLTAVCLVACAASALAQGIIIVPEPPVPPPGPRLPVFLRDLKLDVRIEGQTAVTKVEHTFYNPSDLRLEGTFYHPLPKDAAITDFSLWVGGVKTRGEVLPRDQARGIYESIVRRQRDPGLLEFVGCGLFQARIFPIEPRSELKVEIEYAEVLRADAGLSRYLYPLRIHEKDARGRFRDAVITVQVEAPAPLRALYSPSHEVEIKSEGERKAVVGFESTGRGLDSDFLLYTSVSPQDLAVHLLTDRAFDEDGSFLLLVSPPRAASAEERLPKDVVFVVDTSGSMREEDRIERARRALAYGIKGLGERDRFNLVSFGTSVNPMSEGLVPATPENVNRALETVQRLRAGGGTHISEALVRALRCFGTGDPERRPRMIVFMTDGKPTVGVTNPDELLALVSKSNAGKVRIFSFGVGVDLSTRLLDQLSTENFGTTEYVDARSDMELAVSSFFDKVDYPALSDVDLRIEGVDVYDLYPSGVSDLFFGEQLTILGRYRQPGKAKIVVRGWKEEKQESYEFPDLEFGRSERHPFVPRLWASRRIGYLLEEIRRNGESRELVDEIVELGQRYGIPSPYASYLVVEDSELDSIARDRASGPMDWPRGQASPDASRRPGAEEPQAPQPTMSAPSPAQRREVLVGGADDGAGAVAVSKEIQERKTADKLDPSGSSAARHAAGRTFYLRDGVWVDSRLLGAEAPAKVPVVRIKALEKAYFELAAVSDELRQLLSVGERLRFRYAHAVVEVGAEGETDLSAESRKLLKLP